MGNKALLAELVMAGIRPPIQYNQLVAGIFRINFALPINWAGPINFRLAGAFNDPDIEENLGGGAALPVNPDVMLLIEKLRSW